MADSEGEWQQWPEEAFHEGHVRSPAEGEWEQWPIHAHNGNAQSGVDAGHVSSGAEDEWEQWPVETMLAHDRNSQTGEDEAHTNSSAEDEWEQWPGETMLAHHSSPQRGEETWEEWPEEAMHGFQTLSRPEEVIRQNLEATLHPALRSSFKIQENWDRAPETLSHVMAGANPQAAALLPLTGEPEPDSLREKTTHGKRRRHRSRAPSPELNNRHRHRRRHRREHSEDIELNSPLVVEKEEPRHQHRRHRRCRSGSPKAEADLGDMVNEGDTGVGDHIRRRHDRSDRDGHIVDHEDRRLRHRHSSHVPGRPRSRTTATRHDQEHSLGEHESTSNSHRRRRHHKNRQTEREPSPELPSRFRRMALG